MAVRPTAISRDGSAYRRGIVLGLTMAEVLLLLVFCLLIAASVVFVRERTEREKLARTVQETAGKLEEVAQERDALAEIAKVGRRGSPREIDDLWQKLVSAKVAVDRMQNAGLSPDKLIENASDLLRIEKLVEGGLKRADIAAVLEADTELRRHLHSQGLEGTPLSDLARLAAAGRGALGEGNAPGAGRGEHSWPPIISLSEARGYSFPVGSAELSADFARALRGEIAMAVAAIVKSYDVDIVEVIGHTDEQPLSRRPSNLDSDLVPALVGRGSILALTPADNAGLGMARAVSVAKVLRSDARLHGVTVLPLSAAQLILPGDTLTRGSEPGQATERRRIEIRVRRSERKLQL
jgi:flagellar motor protein MotB